MRKTQQLFTARAMCTADFRQLLACYNLELPLDNQQVDIAKINLESFKACTGMLKSYYLPCKAKVYLKEDTLTSGRLLTILRHILKTQGYQLSKALVITKCPLVQPASTKVQIKRGEVVLEF